MDWYKSIHIKSDMKKVLNNSDVIDIFKEIYEEITLNKEYLTDLDAAMGDGDLGITMSEGFKSITTGLEKLSEEKPGKLISKAGMIIAESAPSTMGTLIATAMLRAGKALSDHEEISLENIVEAGNAAVKGIMDRGKAQQGDKTLLDALIPAVDSLALSFQNKESLQESFEKAHLSAVEGMENTKTMKSVHGRGGYYGEKTIGKIDPGSAAIAVIFKGIKNRITKI